MQRTRRGITLMETVLSVLLVGGVLAATLQVVGPTARATQLAGDEALAIYLADELLQEIDAQPYEDPATLANTIGTEAGESAPGNRSSFDDVDDYHGWSGNVQNAVGVAMTGLSGTWTRSVTVVFVPLGAPNGSSLTDTGVKRVTVSVSKNGTVLATRRMLRTRSYDTAMETE